MNDFYSLNAVAARYQQRYLSRQFKKIGLPFGHHLFILCVCDNEGITQDQLAEKLLLNKSTVARALSALEKQGFIYKTLNAKDKRIFNVYPTVKSQQIFPEILHIIGELNQKLLLNFSSQQKEEFSSLFQNYMHNTIDLLNQDEKVR